MKKRVLAMMMAAAMAAASLTGCGGSSTGETAAQTTAAQAAAEEAVTEAVEGAAENLSGADVRVAMISDTVGVNLFLTQCVEAMEEKAAEYGFQYSVMECADSDEWKQNVEAAVQEDYNLIIGVGWQAAEYVAEAADNYPDKARYAVIDTVVDNDAVTSIDFVEVDAAYLIGVMAAAAFPESKMFGYIGSNQSQSSYEYRWGFMEGVKSLTPDAQFTFNFTQSYTDTSKPYEFAKQQSAAGCTFIFGGAAAGNAGIYQAAMDLAAEGTDIYTIGQDADETTADNPHILASQLKNTGNMIRYIVDNYMAGTLQGGVQTLGIKEDAVGAGFVTEDGAYRNEEILTDEVLAKCKAAAEELTSGKVVLEVPLEQ